MSDVFLEFKINEKRKDRKLLKSKYCFEISNICIAKLQFETNLSSI